MKNEKTINDSTLTAFAGRLEAEASRAAAELEHLAGGFAESRPGEDAQAIARHVLAEREARGLGDRDPKLLRLFELDKPCGACGGKGWFENEERAEVPHYRIITHRAQAPGQSDQAHFVDAPKTNIRTICKRCAGRGRTLTPSGTALLESLVLILQDQVRPEAATATIDEFNTRQRATLAARAKAHEADRVRHEAADQFEREAAEKAAAIRAGKIPAPAESRK